MTSSIIWFLNFPNPCAVMYLPPRVPGSLGRFLVKSIRCTGHARPVDTTEIYSLFNIQYIKTIYLVYMRALVLTQEMISALLIVVFVSHEI